VEQAVAVQALTLATVLLELRTLAVVAVAPELALQAQAVMVVLELSFSSIQTQ
jgi:hypothetical protein